MKNLTLFTVFILLICSGAFTQPCLPEGITFSSQAAIDNFQANYPGCTGIEGDVLIRGSDITHLDGLMVLGTIGGELRIYGNNNLLSIVGLQNLTMVTGSLVLEDNKSLPSLSGLEQLTCIGGNLDIIDCDALYDLHGLNNVTGACGDLNILRNYTLHNLAGLEGMQCVAGHILIARNDVLTNIEGIGNISAATIEEVTIIKNPALSSCAVESISYYLQAPGGAVNIYDNNSCCNNPSEVALSGGFALPCLPYGNYHFYNQLEIDRFATNYPGCDVLTGTVYIRGPEIISLEGLLPVSAIDGDLIIDQTEALETLSGLENITSVSGSLHIGSDFWYYNGNEALASLNGLNGLVQVGQDLIIADNSILTGLAGLEQLTTVGGDLKIGGPMSGLSGGNPQLTSISSLLYLISIGGDLEIINNASLADCVIDAVCDYINYPAGSIVIENNAGGCSSIDEVQAGCEGLAVSESDRGPVIRAYPNPVTAGLLHLEYTTENRPGPGSTLVIMNSLGQRVHQLDLPANSKECDIHVAGWEPGLYLVLLYEGGKATSKVTVILE